VALLVALLLDVWNKTLEMEHQNLRWRSQALFQVSKATVALLTSCLDCFSLEVGRQHSFHRSSCVTLFAIEVQGEVSKVLRDRPSVLALHADQLLLNLGVEELRGQINFVLHVVIGDLSLPGQQQFVMQLVHVLEEELMSVLLTTATEHRRCQPNLFS